jgi:hypothetical protein
LSEASCRGALDDAQRRKKVMRGGLSFAYCSLPVKEK